MTLLDIMPRWTVYRGCIYPVLDALGLDFRDVAYVNLLKWRTQPSVSLARLYELSWLEHTADQIAMLAPGEIFVLGKGAAAQLRWVGGDAPTITPLARLFNNLSAEGKASVHKLRLRRCSSTEVGIS